METGREKDFLLYDDVNELLPDISPAQNDDLCRVWRRGRRVLEEPK
jgi:hypothetical protein